MECKYFPAPKKRTSRKIAIFCLKNLLTNGDLGSFLLLKKTIKGHLGLRSWPPQLYSGQALRLRDILL